jgi:hypothetical protein
VYLKDQGVPAADIRCVGKITCVHWMGMMARHLFAEERCGRDTLKRREMILGESKVWDDLTLVLVGVWRWKQYKGRGGKR